MLAQIERVVTSADATLAWKLVDPETQQVVEGLYGEEKAYVAALQQQPQSAAVTTEHERVKASTEVDVAHFFAAQCHAWQLIESYRKRLGSASGPVQKKEDAPGSMWLARYDGMAFHVVKVGSGWAWADLKGEWQLEARHVKKAATELRGPTKPTKPTKNEGP